MSKKIFYDNDARQRLLRGAEELYKAVKTTLGPKGRNVVLSKSFGSPTITHDGVTVAKGIDLPDDDPETYGFKIGAELIKQAASKMNDVAGDGTTTVTILTYHLLSEANKLITAGHNPMLLRKGLERAAESVLQELAQRQEDIGSDKKRVAQVATISAGDPEVGNLIADVMNKVGQDGVVTVEEGQGLELEADVVEGFTFDRGFISPYMVTDTNRMEAVYDKPAIVITNQKISSMQEILPLVEKIIGSGKKDVVFIAEDVEGEALPTFVVNKLKGVFNAVAVKAPAFGDQKTAILEDMAVLTGATVINPDQGVDFKTADLDVIGTARKVIVSKDETTIVEGGGQTKDVQDRISQIKSQANIAESDYQVEQLTKRAAALTGKVAVIRVGGASETEIEEKKFRVDDAVAAVKAALAEGVVVGGGVTLLGLADKVATGESQSDDPTVAAARQILINALQQPFRILLQNSGINADQWLSTIQEKSRKGENVGIDVSQSEVELVDLKTRGVIDPVRVTREAIQSAASIAGTAITMGALVVEIPEKDNSPAGGGLGGNPMGGLGGM